MKVLVVEDDLEINELLGEYLSLENIQPLSATTGQGGIRLALAEHPDAVILDLMLPDIDGFEVAHTLSTSRATYDIPIVILSCMNQTADRERGFACGALHYMCKPFLPDDLLATLRTATEWRKALQSRVAGGRIVLGGATADACGMGTSLHDLSSDLFARTGLSDEGVAARRGAVETVNGWVERWNREHASDRGGKTQVLVDYRVVPTAGEGGADVEWTFSETGGPGILSDAFFRPATQSQTGKLLGWGASVLGAKPASAGAEMLPPPQPWMDLLSRLGGSGYVRDAKSRTVRVTPSVAVSAVADVVSAK